ncbi:unnamed protein product [Echinostoma caproni]|uniref:XPGN domain-containing protein n=1 Tax=Echinostoma caproni TaxID=27848 RepID=A0A183AB24_9TREM|nr:unnamed protein product [Echinostoma caproni]
MGVKGLTSYVNQNSANFADFQLHNTWVVIDAMNFIHYVYIDKGLDTQFNGENFDLQIAIIKVLRVFQRCLVRPVFLFDGCHVTAKLSTQLNRARDRLQTSRTVAHLALKRPDANHTSLRVPILPPLAPLVLAQTLTALHIPFVVSDRESDEDAVGLAMHLRCPVISNDSDFYITIPSDVPGTCLLPLRFLSWTAKPCAHPCAICNPSVSTGPRCHYISCRKFLLNGPAFYRLPPIQRPLFATLIGNDYIPSQRFVSVLPCTDGLKKPLNGSATKTMRRNRRCKLYRTVIDWLAGFGDDVREPVSRLLNRIPTAQRARAEAQLEQSLLSYRIASAYVQTVLYPFLSLNSPDKTSTQLFSDEADENLRTETASSPSKCSSEDEEESTDRSDSENFMCEETTKSDLTFPFPDSLQTDQSHELITVSWPESLVSQYRRYRILPVYIDALYSGGSVLNCGIEAIRECPSIHTCTDSIRSLLCGLILGCSELQHSAIVESSEQNACAPAPVNDIGRPRFMTEYVRKGGFQIRASRTPIEAIRLDLYNSTSDCRIAFLQRVFSKCFDPTQPHTTWLHALALFVCVWLKYGALADRTIDPKTCPYLMSFLTIAIVRHVMEASRITTLYRPNDLKREKRELVTLARRLHSLSALDNNFSEPFDLYTVHVFGQLQLIYATLSSLGSVLDGLGGTFRDPKKCIPLDDICTTLPSGRLYHALVRYLQHSSTTENLFSLVLQDVLPRILTSHDEKALSEARGHLDNCLSLVSHFTESFTGPDWSGIEKPASRKLHPERNRPAPNTNSLRVKTARKRRTNGKRKQPQGISMLELNAAVERIMLENDLTD